MNAAFRLIHGTTSVAVSRCTLPHTPASRAGLVPGLVVREIDGTPTEGKLPKECVDMLRGAVGTKVRLELVDLENSKTNTVELTRERVL